MSSLVSRFRIRGRSIAAGVALVALGAPVVPGCLLPHEAADHCPSEPPRAAGPCGDLHECGPYEVDTPCGPESAVAICTVIGWSYETECKPDCVTIPDEATCDSTFNCLWVVPCSKEPDLIPRCIRLGGHSNACSSEEPCDDGLSCTYYSINPVYPKNSDCTYSGAQYNVCLPPDEA